MGMINSSNKHQRVNIFHAHTKDHLKIEANEVWNKIQIFSAEYSIVFETMMNQQPQSVYHELHGTYSLKWKNHLMRNFAAGRERERKFECKISEGDRRELVQILRKRMVAHRHFGAPSLLLAIDTLCDISRYY